MEADVTGGRQQLLGGFGSSRGLGLGFATAATAPSHGVHPCHSRTKGSMAVRHLGSSGFATWTLMAKQSSDRYHRSGKQRTQTRGNKRRHPALARTGSRRRAAKFFFFLRKVKIFIPRHEYITNMNKRQKKTKNRRRRQPPRQSPLQQPKKKKNINWQASHVRVAGLEDF